MTTRVLLIGFASPPQPRQDEQMNTLILRCDGEVESEIGFRPPKVRYMNFAFNPFFEPNIPTAYDYHIVVVSKEAVRYASERLATKKDDFLSLMWAPFHGTLVVPIIGDNKNYDGWVPTLEKLKARDGAALKLRDKHWLCSFMKKYQKNLTWRAHAENSITSYDEEHRDRYIATNIADNPVAFETPLHNGRTIYLPFYNFGLDLEESGFLRDLLDSIENRYKQPKGEEVPSWAAKPAYRLPSEEEFERQAKTIEQERVRLSRTRSILWLSGIDLVNSVAQTLAALGIRCEVKEIEGRHDIEIHEPGFHAVMEVKGLGSYANYQDIRQLLDWYAEAIKADENVKGIFLLNDFREVEPELRQAKLRETIKDVTQPFTREAVRIAVSNDFCLLTCYQLFQLVKLNMLGKFNKSVFIEHLRSTKGVYSLGS